MRIAFIGKGGAGKSSIVGTFARLLARADARPVIVLDTDVMPGLAHALGIEATDAAIPDDDVVENEEERPRYRLRDGLTAQAAVEAHALACPDGVRLLQMGKLRGHASDLTRSQFAFRQIARELAQDSAWHLVGDLAGGTRQPFFGWGEYAETFVVVVEPTAKSFLTARRMTRLAGLTSHPNVVAVANKVSHPNDRDRVEQATGLRVIGEIPWDPMIGDADRAGKAVLDIAPDTPAVESIRSLLEWLREEWP